MNSFIRNLIVLILVASFALPNFVSAADNVGVRQPVGTVIVSGNPNQDTTAPQIFDVAVKAQDTKAEIFWSTDELGSGKVGWGTSQDYRDGVIVAEQFAAKHSALLTGLTPQTQYYFFITAFDQYGNARTYEGQFLTLVAPDTTPPANVSEFMARPQQDHIDLSWINPGNRDFKEVRLVRSTKFFPLDPLNGEVLYEGGGNQFTDSSVAPGTVYFYSLFSRDKTGNYSSGAWATATIVWYSESSPEAPVVDLQLPTAPTTPSKPATINDFEFTYNQGSVNVHPDNLTIPNGTDLRIVVNKNNLPKETSFLSLTTQDPGHSVTPNTYLFSYDKLSGQYWITIPAEILRKTAQLIIVLYNSVKQVIQKILTEVHLTISTAHAASNSFIQMVPQFPWIALLIILLIILIWLWYRYRYRRKNFKPISPRRRPTKKQ